MRSVLGRDNCSAIGLGLEVGFPCALLARLAKSSPSAHWTENLVNFQPEARLAVAISYNSECGRRNLNENRNQDIF